MIKYILDFEDIPGPTTLSFLHIFNPLSSNGDLNIWARDQIEAPKCCLHTHQDREGDKIQFIFDNMSLTKTLI